MRRRRGSADAALVEALGRVPMFADLGTRQLSAVAGAVKEVEQPEGAVLAREGETGAGFFLIIEGTAQVRIADRVHRELGPGDSFGEVALLDGGPRTATVVATSPREDACEACVTVEHPDGRISAFAVRLERHLGVWRVADLAAPESGLHPLPTASFPDGYTPRDAFDEAEDEEQGLL
jgi:hypothetical protein